MIHPTSGSKCTENPDLLHCSLPQEGFTPGLGLENILLLLLLLLWTLPTEVNDTKCHGDHAAGMSSKKTGQSALGKVYVEEWKKWYTQKICVHGICKQQETDLSNSAKSVN